MSRRWQYRREIYPSMELVLTVVLFILCVGQVCSQELWRNQVNPSGSLETDQAAVWSSQTDAGAAVSQKTDAEDVRSLEIVTRYEWNNGTESGVAGSPGTEKEVTGNSYTEAGITWSPGTVTGETKSPGTEVGETGNSYTEAGITWSPGIVAGETKSPGTEVGETGNSYTEAGITWSSGTVAGETKSPGTEVGETGNSGTEARETGNSGTGKGDTGKPGFEAGETINSGTVAGETGSPETKPGGTVNSGIETGETGSPGTKSGETGILGTKSGETWSPGTEAREMLSDATIAETQRNSASSEVNLSSKIGGEDAPAAEFLIPEGVFTSLEEWNLQELSSRLGDTSCMCVPFYQCTSDGYIKTDGADIMDIRNRFGPEPVYNVETCPDEVDSTHMKCCKLPPGAPPVPLRDSTPLPARLTDTTEAASRLKPCGTRSGYVVADDWLRVSAGEDTSFGEFPWMLALLESSGGPGSIATFKCGASLIHPQVALTTAHCVTNLSLAYTIRAGEYDTSGQVEGLPHQDRCVTETLIPDNYNPRSLTNNIALLVLHKPVTPADNVGTICLPEKEDRFDDKFCVATGWGRHIADGKNGGYHTLLKKVDLTATPARICQTELRTTRLGIFFILDPSFICAKGMRNQDTCSGDGGGPLACPNREDQSRYSLAGAVSWGIGCGSKISGVYANIAHNRYWIDDQLSSRGFAANEPL